MNILCVWICAVVLGVVAAQNCNECNCTILSGGSVTIKSPNYPNNYPSSASVCWIIESGPSNMYPVVSVNAFRTEFSRDEVSIYSGTPTSYFEQLLVQWSGAYISAGTSQTSSGTGMLIRFSSDSSVQYSGFSLQVGLTFTPYTTTTSSYYNNNYNSGSSYNYSTGLQSWHFGLISFGCIFIMMILCVVLGVLRSKGIIKGGGSRHRRTGVAVVNTTSRPPATTRPRQPMRSQPPPPSQPMPFGPPPPYQQKPILQGSSINNNPNYTTVYSDPAYPPGAGPTAPPPQNIYASAAAEAAG